MSFNLKTPLVLLGFATVGAQAHADAVPPQVVGHYTHFDVVAYNDPQPIGTMRSVVITYGLTDLTEKDGQLVETDTFCHSEQKSNLPVQATVLDSFTRAITPRNTVVEVSGPEGQWTVLRPETPTGIGIHLADPRNDPLPTDPKDPRIADDDHDGHPGVTVYLDLGFTKGELYLARREIFSYEMHYNADGGFEGVVHDRSEQLTLGANPSFLATQHHPVQDPDLSKSPIALRRLPGQYTCDQLMAERDMWFPKAPDVD